MCNCDAGNMLGLCAFFLVIFTERRLSLMGIAVLYFAHYIIECIHIQWYSNKAGLDAGEIYKRYRRDIEEIQERYRRYFMEQMELSSNFKNKRQTVMRALKCAFPYTIPIFAGFWFLGLTYGIYMNVSGFSFWYPMFMSMTIFAGSVEFITVNLLLGAFNPIQALAMALMVNARPVRFADKIQYGRARVRYDCDVCRDFYGTVVKGKAARVLADRAWCLSAVSRAVRRG